MKKTVLLSAVAGVFLASCAGNPEGKKAATGDAVDASTEVAGVVYTVDPQASKLVWTGKKVTGSHTGTVDIKSGSLHVDGDKITGGSFVVDMPTLVDLSLEGEANAMLTGHLKSNDFFDVENHPESTFEITGVEAGEAENDLKVSGNLTIRGITKNITFDATVSELTDASAKVDADFNIAREDWGVNYTGKADDLISKEINFKVSLVAVK